MTTRLVLGPILLVVLLVGGCKETKPEKLYEFQGKVIAVDTTKQTVTVDHEDIPGLMKAMQMNLRVENAGVLDGLKAGDQVQGVLKKTESGYLITRLEKR